MPFLRIGLGLLALGLLGLPTGAQPSAACALDAASPPCGYIMPYMDVSFEGKERCGSVFGGDPTGCPPILAKGESETYQGTLVWHWDVTQDGIYPPSADQPVAISFDGSGNNPPWMEFTVEPEGFTLGPADFADPANYRTDESDPLNPRLEFWYERTVDVTITRTGDPSAEDLESLAKKGGLVQFGVKARSTESGTYYKRAFTLEEFRYDGRSLLATDGGERESPGIGPVALLGAVAAAGVALRRRA